MKKISLYLFLLLFFLLNPFTKTVRAANSCGISLSQIDVYDGENLTITVADVILNDRVVTSSNAGGFDGDFYIEFNPGELKTGNLVITNGSGSITSEAFLDIRNFSNGLPQTPGEYSVTLKHYLGAAGNFGETICEATQTVVIHEGPRPIIEPEPQPEPNPEPEPAGDLCSNGTGLDSNLVLIPSDIDRTNTFSGVVRAPLSFVNKTVYLNIIKIDETFGPAPQGLSVPILITDSDGDGIASGTFRFLIDEQYPNLENGNFQVWIGSFSNVNSSNLCVEPRPLTVFGESSCKSLNEECSEEDTIPPCANYVCNPETGRIVLPQLSTFEFICTRPNPPLCTRCEIFEDGTRTCIENYTENPADCVVACTYRPEVSYLCTTSTMEFGIDTAIGCIPLENIHATTAFLWKFAFGIGGGITLIMISYSAFLFMTSEGNPDKMGLSKEFLVAAISGLAVIVMAGFILNLVGVNVLGLFM